MSSFRLHVEKETPKVGKLREVGVLSGHMYE